MTVHFSEFTLSADIGTSCYVLILVRNVLLDLAENHADSVSLQELILVQTCCCVVLQVVNVVDNS
jgi:hypothetical protein